MRDLKAFELDLVGGACGAKNNNGYGNGPESGPPPGNSGGNNLQLLADNLGAKGCR